MARNRAQVWTPAAIRELGATTGIETAGAVIGMGRTTAYALAKAGNFPVRLIRIGRRYVVPVADILDLLGVEQCRRVADERTLATNTRTN